MTTYTLTVRYKDGTRHDYTKLSRVKLAALMVAQFRDGLDRPETVTVTTQRDSHNTYNK